MGFAPPTIAQAIEVLVRNRPGLTQTEIAKIIFGEENGYQQRVNQDCSWMVGKGYIKSDGGRPARYTVGRPGPVGNGT